RPCCDTPGVTAVPEPSSPRRRIAAKLLVLAVPAAAFVAQAAGALLPNAPLLLAATAASLVVEGLLYRWQPGMLTLFAKSHADITVRHVLRDLQIGRAHV